MDEYGLLNAMLDFIFTLGEIYKSLPDRAL